VHLRVRDWPGWGGPLVHVPDPLAPDDGVVGALSAALAPRYRVLSVTPRGSSPYQVDMFDVLGVLNQLGFEQPVLVGERLGCVPVMLIGAWHPSRVAGLVLIEPSYVAPVGNSVEARTLRECPPDWPKLRAASGGRSLHVERVDGDLPRQVEAFLAATLP
jgi:pimeloyl-ACP methyl ester carboxylesterase